ncbi:MAG: hypothetical protein AAB941_02635 [Patescibacteria group bacterium]
MRKINVTISLKKLLKKLKDGEQSKEDLYIKILLWAHDKQESGFTWDEMKSHFNLNNLQEGWVRKIFLTTSDTDRKFFEHLRNDDTVTPNVHYHSLNEKGVTAAINYKGLQHAEKSSERALWFASLSIFLTAIGLFFTIKQTNLTEIQSTSERINQARSVQSAIEFCEQNPGTQDSGLFEVSTGKSAPCDQVIRNYKKERSLWEKIQNAFNF